MATGILGPGCCNCTPPGYTVTAVCSFGGTAANGARVPGVDVTITETTTAASYGPVTADSSGLATFTGVANGTYKFSTTDTSVSVPYAGSTGTAPQTFTIFGGNKTVQFVVVPKQLTMTATAGPWTGTQTAPLVSSYQHVNQTPNWYLCWDTGIAAFISTSFPSACTATGTQPADLSLTAGPTTPSWVMNHHFLFANTPPCAGSSGVPGAGSCPPSPPGTLVPDPSGGSFVDNWTQTISTTPPIPFSRTFSTTAGGPIPVTSVTVTY
jgi:hypothetical protein